MSGGGAPAGEWDVTVSAPGGGVLPRVRVRGARVEVEPPDAEAHPFVAAAVAEMRRTVTRPRARPACARDPLPPGPA